MHIRLVLLLASLAVAEGVPTPEEFLGFPVGEDRKLARFEQVAAYFHRVDEASDRVEVVELGKTTEGNPFLMALVASPANLGNQAAIRAAQARLRDPRRGEPAEADRIAAAQPAVVLITNNIHSSEIASSQMVLRVLHRLATDDGPEVREILEHVFLLLVPSLNPDGQIKVVDWYRKNVGTPQEGGEMPWLYHRYAGHDNNRDAFMLALQETRLITRVLYHDWFPVVLCDHHQMGAAGPRMFVPPYKDPINASIDPVLWRELEVLGGVMAMDLEAAGKAGVVHAHSYDAYWLGGTRITPLYHNVVGILTETASARVASPMEPGAARRRETTDTNGDAAGDRTGRRSWAGPTVAGPNPWKERTWHLGDIVAYQEISTWALLRAAARHRVELNRNYLAMNRRAVEKGEAGGPYAYLFPAAQRDGTALRRLLDALAQAGVELKRAAAPFETEGRSWPVGTIGVLLAQPPRAYVKELLGTQRFEEGSPGTREDDRFYDVTGWCLPMQMGVEAVAVDRAFAARWEPLDPAAAGAGRVDPAAPGGWWLGREDTGAYVAVNRLFRAGVEVQTLGARAEGRAAGTFWIPPGGETEARLREVADALRVVFEARAAGAPPGAAHPLRQPRLGLYRPWQANMDEGWTRLVLESFEFPFEALTNAEVRAGGLSERFDAIVIPAMDERALVSGSRGERIPEEYRGGLGDEGCAALRAFVEGGGTLIGLGAAANALAQRFDLPFRNALAGMDRKRFYCPGSILRVRVDPAHPLAYGAREELDVFFLASPALEATPGFPSRSASVVGKFPGARLLRSGYLRGEELLAERVVLAEVAEGRGRFMLLAPRVQHRAQAHGTFRLLFNAILRGGA